MSADDTDDPLGLVDVLDERWSALKDILMASPAAPGIIGRERPETIVPRREETFRAINYLGPAEWKVVIFGQNPYARAESASGTAFCDRAVAGWGQKGIPPSLRNILKSVLISAGKISRSANIAHIRALLPALALRPPPQWFIHTIVNGVCWLNTSLTVDTATKTAHDAFWAPVIRSILATMLAAKQAVLDAAAAAAASAPPPPVGIVVVLWGSRANTRLRKIVDALAAPLAVPVRYVTAHVPSVESFFDVDSFGLINAALVDIGYEPIDWLPTASSALFLPLVIPGPPPHHADTPATDTRSASPPAATAIDPAILRHLSDDPVLGPHVAAFGSTPPLPSATSTQPTIPLALPAPAAPPAPIALADLDQFAFGSPPRKRRPGPHGRPAASPAAANVKGAAADAAGASERKKQKPMAGAAPQMIDVAAYEIDPTLLVQGKTVGVGGYGSVREARLSGQRVAVKTLHGEYDAKVRAAFEAEVSLLVRLDHPNIIKLKAVCLRSPRPCMVLELMDCSFGAAISRAADSPARFLPLAAVITVLADVAKALKYLHSLAPPVVHRDLKPANILVDAALSRAVVCDFGVSREIASAGTMTKIGTPVFMSPEILLANSYSATVDVYSFAMVMYMAFTGHVPFTVAGDELGPYQVVFQVASANLRPTLDLDLIPGLPPPLLDLMQAAWNGTPSARPDIDTIITTLDALR